MGKYTPLIVLILALAANIALVADLPLLVEFGAAFLLYNLIPGTLAVSWILKKRLPFAEQVLELYLISLGAGYAISIILMMALSFVPGRIATWHALLAFDLVVLLLLVVRTFGQQISPTSSAQSTEHDDALSIVDKVCGSTIKDKTWLWLGVAILILVAGFLRLPNLSYSEFQDDEATVVWHSAEVIQGRADALFIHDKGPAEILQTTATYSLTARLNEATARLPFSIAGIAGLVALFLLGWQLFGPITGWFAAMLLALDGYFIGFARIVQYQSLVFLMVVLVVLLASKYVANPRTSPRYMWLASVFFATGMLAHYEAIIMLIPAGFLLYHATRNETCSLRTWRDYAVPLLIAAIILALFYVPFALHPRFVRTLFEIAGNRIGGGFPYNNLEDFFFRTTIYSTTYYFVLMTMAAAAGTVAVYCRTMTVWLARICSVLLVIGMLSIFRSPEWPTIAGRDYTWLVFSVALAPAICLPRVKVPDRTIWLWFGIPLILALFFVQKPRTHVYDFFIPWALISGMVFARIWYWLSDRMPMRRARMMAIPVVIGSVLLFGNYAYWLFTYTDQEVLRTWMENRPHGYWVPYSTPAQNAIFGFPFKNGWKVVGHLYADGQLAAPFARNGKRGVANWYTRGIGDCSRDASYYVYTEWNEPTNKGLTEKRERPSMEDGYHLEHLVQVNGETRLEIYSRLPGPVLPPLVHDIADYESTFDEQLSGPLFEATGPSADPAIRNPVHVRFGDRIWLIGYDVASLAAAPGENLELTLYWQADARADISYKVFTQIIDMLDYRKAGQRDGVPGCERYPTDTWQPGDIILDRYAIPILPDAAPGTYTLLVGLYDSDEERLDVYSDDGQHLGDALSLTNITILE